MNISEFQRQIDVSRETLDGFDVWRQILIEWNEHTNLVGRSTLDDFWNRHALDSWQVYEAFPKARVWLDMGSGAGFPGIAIALALKDRQVEGGHVHMVESIHKKAAFLTEVVSQLDLPASIHAVRVEDIKADWGVDIVTARALASLDKLLDYSELFTSNGAKALFPKGAKHKEELTRAQKSWTFKHEVIPSRTASDAALLKLEDIVRARH